MPAYADIEMDIGRSCNDAAASLPAARDLSKLDWGEPRATTGHFAPWPVGTLGTQ